MNKPIKKGNNEEKERRFLFFFLLHFNIVAVLLLLALSVFYGHLVAVDHVKSSVSVSHRFRFATAAVVDETGARGRTGPVVSAAALWVDQECRSSLRDYFARLAPAAGLQLQQQEIIQWEKSTTQWQQSSSADSTTSISSSSI